MTGHLLQRYAPCAMLACGLTTCVGYTTRYQKGDAHPVAYVPPGLRDETVWVVAQLESKRREDQDDDYPDWRISDISSEEYRELAKAQLNDAGYSLAYGNGDASLFLLFWTTAFVFNEGSKSVRTTLIGYVPAGPLRDKEPSAWYGAFDALARCQDLVPRDLENQAGLSTPQGEAMPIFLSTVDVPFESTVSIDSNMVTLIDRLSACGAQFADWREAVVDAPPRAVVARVSPSSEDDPSEDSATSEADEAAEEEAAARREAREEERAERRRQHEENMAELRERSARAHEQLQQTLRQGFVDPMAPYRKDIYATMQADRERRAAQQEEKRQQDRQRSLQQCLTGAHTAMAPPGWTNRFSAPRGQLQHIHDMYARSCIDTWKQCASKIQGVLPDLRSIARDVDRTSQDRMSLSMKESADAPHCELNAETVRQVSFWCIDLGGTQSACVQALGEAVSVLDCAGTVSLYVSQASARERDEKERQRREAQCHAQYGD